MRRVDTCPMAAGNAGRVDGNEQESNAFSERPMRPLVLDKQVSAFA
jgi:hypothetical protein